MYRHCDLQFHARNYKTTTQIRRESTFYRPVSVPYPSRKRLLKNKNRAFTLFFYHATVASKGNTPFIVSELFASVILMQDGFIIKSSVLTVSTFYFRCKGTTKNLNVQHFCKKKHLCSHKSGFSLVKRLLFAKFCECSFGGMPTRQAESEVTTTKLNMQIFLHFYLFCYVI